MYGRHLDAGDEFEVPALTGALVGLSGEQGAAHIIVVSDGDDIEERVPLDALEDRERVVHPVTERGVHLEVGAPVEGDGTGGRSKVGHPLDHRGHGDCESQRMANLGEWLIRPDPAPNHL